MSHVCKSLRRLHSYQKVEFYKNQFGLVKLTDQVHEMFDRVKYALGPVIGFLYTMDTAIDENLLAMIWRSKPEINLFFFYLTFPSRTFTIQRTAGVREGGLFNCSLPLPSGSQTLRHHQNDYCRELTSAHSLQHYCPCCYKVYLSWCNARKCCNRFLKPTKITEGFLFITADCVLGF